MIAAFFLTLILITNFLMIIIKDFEKFETTRGLARANVCFLFHYYNYQIMIHQDMKERYTHTQYVMNELTKNNHLIN